MYECTGSPLPSNIDAIVGALLDELFAAAYETTHALCKAKALGKGYALADVVSCIVELVVDLALPAAALAPLMVALAPLMVALELTLVVSIREISKLKMPSAMRLLRINSIRGGRRSFGWGVNSEPRVPGLGRGPRGCPAEGRTRGRSSPTSLPLRLNVFLTS